MDRPYDRSGGKSVPCPSLTTFHTYQIEPHTMTASPDFEVETAVDLVFFGTNCSRQEEVEERKIENKGQNSTTKSTKE